MFIEAAHSFMDNVFVSKEDQLVRLDGGQSARLVNMRIRKNKQHKHHLFTSQLSNLRALAKYEDPRKGLQHWLSHKTYVCPERDTIYEQVLHQIVANGNANNLLKIEKYWTQNAMHSFSMTTNDAWLDANICASPQQIEDQYRKIQDLESKLQNSAMDTPETKAALIEQIGQDLICVPGFLDDYATNEKQAFLIENTAQEHNLIEDKSRCPEQCGGTEKDSSVYLSECQLNGCHPDGDSMMHLSAG